MSQLSFHLEVTAYIGKQSIYFLVVDKEWTQFCQNKNSAWARHLGVATNQSTCINLVERISHTELLAPRSRNDTEKCINATDHGIAHILL